MAEESNILRWDSGNYDKDKFLKVFDDNLESRALWLKETFNVDPEDFKLKAEQIKQQIINNLINHISGNRFTIYKPVNLLQTGSEKDQNFYLDDNVRRVFSYINNIISTGKIGYSDLKTAFSPAFLRENFLNYNHPGRLSIGKSELSIWNNRQLEDNLKQFNNWLTLYINDTNLGKYDFTNSAFKTKDEYVKRLLNVQLNLTTDKYNTPQQMAALSAAGFDVDNYKSLFGLLAPEKTDFESKWEPIALKLKETGMPDEEIEKRKQDAITAYQNDLLNIDTALLYKQLMGDAFKTHFLNITLNKISPRYITFSGLNSIGNTLNYVLDKNGFDKLINFSNNLFLLIRNGASTKNLLLGKTIDGENSDGSIYDMMILKAITETPGEFTKINDNLFIINETINNANATAFKYDKSTHTLTYYQAPVGSKLFDYFKTKFGEEYTKKNKDPFLYSKKGGKLELLAFLRKGKKIQKALFGTLSKLAQNVTEEEVVLNKKDNYSLQIPGLNFSNNRMNAALLDIGSTVAGLVPGGSIPGAVLGLAGTGFNLAEDIKDPSVGGLEATGNALFNTGMDLLGVFPYAGEVAKVGKLGKTMKWIGPIMLSSGLLTQISHGDRTIDAIKLAMSDPSKVTIEQWKDIANAAALMAGTGKYVTGKVKAHKFKNELNPNATKRVLIKDGDHKGEYFDMDLQMYDDLKSLSPTDEAKKTLKYLKEKYGDFNLETDVVDAPKFADVNHKGLFRRLERKAVEFTNTPRDVQYKRPEMITHLNQLPVQIANNDGSKTVESIETPSSNGKSWYKSLWDKTISHIPRFSKSDKYGGKINMLTYLRQGGEINFTLPSKMQQGGQATLDSNLKERVNLLKTTTWDPTKRYHFVYNDNPGENELILILRNPNGTDNVAATHDENSPKNNYYDIEKGWKEAEQDIYNAARDAILNDPVNAEAWARYYKDNVGDMSDVHAGWFNPDGSFNHENFKLTAPRLWKDKKNGIGHDIFRGKTYFVREGVNGPKHYYDGRDTEFMKHYTISKTPDNNPVYNYIDEYELIAKPLNSNSVNGTENNNNIKDQAAGEGNLEVEGLEDKENPEGENSNSFKRRLKPFDPSIGIDATRLFGHLWNNNRIALLSNMKHAVLLSPKIGHLNIYGDFAALQNYNKQASDILSKARRLADGTANTEAGFATWLDAQRIANQLKETGYRVDNDMIRRDNEKSDALNRSRYDENHKFKGINDERINAEIGNHLDNKMARLSANMTNVDNYLSGISADIKTRINDMKTRAAKAYLYETDWWANNQIENDSEYKRLFTEYSKTGDPKIGEKLALRKLAIIAALYPQRMQQKINFARGEYWNPDDFKPVKVKVTLPEIVVDRRGGRVDSSRMRYRADDLRELRKLIRHNIDTNRRALDNLSKATLLELKKMMGI